MTVILLINFFYQGKYHIVQNRNFFERNKGYLEFMEFRKTVANSFASLIFCEHKILLIDTNVRAFESIGIIIRFFFEN